MAKAKECREQRADEIAQMQELVERAKKDSRAFTPEEMVKFDQHDAAAKKLLEQAESWERIESFEGLSKREIHNTLRTNSHEEYRPGPSRNRHIEDRNHAYKGWLTRNTKAWRTEYGHAADRLGFDVDCREIHLDWTEKRANVVGSPTLGGDLVATDTSLMGSIEVALKQFGFDYDEVATVITTDTGANLPIPTNNDTSNSGRIDPEYYSSSTSSYGGMTETDLTLGQYIMNAYRFDSDLVKVSHELLQDSRVDIGAFIGSQLGVRIARNLAYYVTNGLGSSSQQPNGLLNAATLGWTTASSSSITYNDINSFAHAIDPAYYESPGFRFMFSNSLHGTLAGILDLNGRPLFYSGLQGFGVAAPKTLLDKPYVINQQMPAMAAGNKVMLAGDFKKLLVRRVAGPEGGIILGKLVERFSELGLVAFYAWGRFDSTVIDAGQHPIQYMQML